MYLSRGTRRGGTSVLSTITLVITLPRASAPQPGLNEKPGWNLSSASAPAIDLSLICFCGCACVRVCAFVCTCVWLCECVGGVDGGRVWARERYHLFNWDSQVAFIRDSVNASSTLEKKKKKNRVGKWQGKREVLFFFLLYLILKLKTYWHVLVWVLLQS